MTFLERVSNEPALITSLLVAIFNLFAVDHETSGPIIQLAGVLIPILAGFFVRSRVAGPKTAQTLANAVLDAKVGDVVPSANAVGKAYKVIKMPNVQRND